MSHRSCPLISIKIVSTHKISVKATKNTKGFSTFGLTLNNLWFAGHPTSLENEVCFMCSDGKSAIAIAGEVKRN